MKTTKTSNHKGGRRRGGILAAWYWQGKTCWYATIEGRAVRLYDEFGQSLRDPKAKEAADKARARLLAGMSTGPAPAPQATPQTITAAPAPVAGISATGKVIPNVSEMAKKYLSHVKQFQSASTYQMRAKFLFNFCYGLPAACMPPNKVDHSKQFHPGYGHLLITEVDQAVILEWLNYNPDWKNHKNPIQAVRRMIRFALPPKGQDMGLEIVRPDEIKKLYAPEYAIGVTDPQAGVRQTHIEEDQEKALLENASPEFRLYLKFMLATGCRPGEASKLNADWYVTTPDGSLFVVPKKEAKTKKKDRIILLPPDLVEMVEGLIKRHPTGPIFRSPAGLSWNHRRRQATFRNLKRKLAKKGCPLDPNAVCYSGRHTFAQRTLEEGNSLDAIAALIGNTTEVCKKHYANYEKGRFAPLFKILKPK